MEVEAKFLVPNKRLFQQLQRVEHLAGYDLTAEEVRQVRDTYLDTADHKILASGHICRRRQQNDQVIVTLKRLKGVDGPIHRREELEAILPAHHSSERWPASLVRDQVLQLVGDEPLVHLFEIEQTRIVRSLMQQERKVAEFSLDRVRMTRNGHKKTFFEVEVELAPAGTEEDLERLVACLQQQWGLPPESRSKFEQAWTFFKGASLEIPRPSASKAKTQKSSRSQSGVPHPKEPPMKKKTLAASPADATQTRSHRTRPASPTDEPATMPTHKPPKKPQIQPDDSMIEAACKTLDLHFQHMLFNEPGTRQGEDIEALHDMRVAIRRMRAAIRVFELYLDPVALKPVVRGLRRTGRALGKVRDLDVFHEKLQRYLDTLPAEEQAGLEPLLQAWRKERAAARRQMLAYLDGKRYARFKEQFTDFLETTRLAHFVVISDKGDPIPYRVRHVVPVAVYRRLADVRAYDEWVTRPDVPVERLHQLRIACKGLRYTLEFFQEVLGPTAKTATNDIKQLQDHLGDLQDAGVASTMLKRFLDQGTLGKIHPPKKKKKSASAVQEPIIAPGVAAYLAFRQTEMQRLIDTFPTAWAHFQSRAFSESIAAAVAVL